MQDRGHRGTPVCVWGAQLVKQSPVMRGGWSGVGGLLTVVASSLQPAPQTQSWGWEGESKKRNTRAKGQTSSDFYCWCVRNLPFPSYFGEIDSKRAPRGGSDWLPQPPLMAMPGLPWANTGIPQASWTQGSVILSVQPCSSRAIIVTPPPPKTRALGSGLGPKELGSGQCTKDQAVFYWEKR